MVGRLRGWFALVCAFALRRLDGRVKVYSEGDPWYAAALEFAVNRSGNL